MKQVYKILKVIDAIKHLMLILLAIYGLIWFLSIQFLKKEPQDKMIKTVEFINVNEMIIEIVYPVFFSYSIFYILYKIYMNYKKINKV